MDPLKKYVSKPIKQFSAEQNAEIDKNYILIEGDVYTRIPYLCVIYNDRVYRKRSGGYQMRVAEVQTTLRSIEYNMAKNLTNIVPASYVQYVPDLELKNKYRLPND